MRRIFIFSACVLTLGAAVVVGAIFARMSAPSGTAIPGLTRVPGTGNAYAIADKPQARQAPVNANQYRSALSATLAQTQSGPASSTFSPATPPAGYRLYPGIVPIAPSWQSSTDVPQNEARNQDTRRPGSQTRTVWVPDPDNPGQYKPKSEQVYILSPTPGQPGVAVPLDESTQQIANLLRELREAQESPPNPEKLQTLRKLVAEQFDKRHKSQVARLADVQAELQRTQEILVRRNGQRDEIIERRVAQLLGEQDPLQWDYQPAVPRLSAASQRYPTSQATPTMTPSYYPPRLNASKTPLQFAYPDIGAGIKYPVPYPPGLPSDPPEASDSHSPEGNVPLMTTWSRIQESRRILAESAGLDATAIASLQPELDKAKEQLAQAHTELDIHQKGLLRSIELKEFDLVNAQKQYEAANIDANRAQKLYEQKAISDSDRRLLQLRANAAKNAVARAEMELNELNQRLHWLNSLAEDSSPQEQLPDASPVEEPEATEETEPAPPPGESPPRPQA